MHWKSWNKESVRKTNKKSNQLEKDLFYRTHLACIPTYTIIHVDNAVDIVRKAIWFGRQ